MPSRRHLFFSAVFVAGFLTAPTIHAEGGAVVKAVENAPDTRERIAALEEKTAGMSSPASPAPAEGFADMKRSFPTRKKFRRRA